MAKGKQKQQAQRPKQKKPTPKRKQKSVRVPRMLADAGGAIGGYLGGPVGAAMGRLGGGLLSKITGYGDYTVNSNTLLQSGPPPSFYNRGDGYVVSHREYITDVASAQTVLSLTYSINPGLSETFPWLSGIASNFEQYEMLGMVFEYRPLSGFATGSNTTLGYLVMATQYDSQDATFANKVEMETYEYSTSGNPAQSLLHPVECSPSLRPTSILLLRSASVTSGSILDYDLGKFTIMVGGQQANNNVVGELWVTYHVRFLKPKLSQMTPYWTYYSATGVDGTHAFGTASANGGRSPANDNIPSLECIGSNTLYFGRPGYYIIEFDWGGSGITGFGSINFGVATADNIISADSTVFPVSGGYALFTSSTSSFRAAIKVQSAGGNGYPAKNVLTVVAPTNLASGNVSVIVQYCGTSAPAAT